MNTYNTIRAINVNEHVEKKDGLTYLSWAWAWDAFKQACPDASYEVVKNANGLPFFDDACGAMVYTRVKAAEQIHEMWLPIMDSRNRAMKRQPYTIDTQRGSINVAAFTMFDVNKTVMRCLVKNLAMFGLGLYIYAGEDLPESDELTQKSEEPSHSFSKPLGATLGHVNPVTVRIAPSQPWAEDGAPKPAGSPYLFQVGKFKMRSVHEIDFVELSSWAEHWNDKRIAGEEIGFKLAQDLDHALTYIASENSKNAEDVPF
jgi:hypothetical protein